MEPGIIVTMKPPVLNWDSWTEIPFPVATVRELRRKRSLQQRAMDRDILVLWNQGRPRAYLDVCPHLGLPLSMGEAKKDTVVCAYHGWTFATEDGVVVDQPTLSKSRACRLKAIGCAVVGGLVFAWIGDPEAHDLALSRLPTDIPRDFSLHRVEFGCPFYFALFNAVDYAHFAEHRFYKEIYAIYRRIRGDSHVPGMPFHWEIVGEDDAAVHLTLPEARRHLSMFATVADFQDEDGVNRFQTFATPVSATKTLYWEVYQPRSESRFVRLAAKAAFHTVVVHLLETEDSNWTELASRNFLAGEKIHLSATDAPLGAHIRKFVMPRQ